MDEVAWQRAWEDQAEGWIAVTGADPLYEHVNKPAFLDLVPPPGRLTLDIGCGEGRLGRELRQLGHRVVGIDGAPSLARRATQTAPSLPVSIGDAHHLPFRSGAADLVVCFMVVMDVDDLDAAVAELARVATDDGTVCLAVLHPIMTSGLFVGDGHHTFALGAYLQPMRHELDIDRPGSGTFRFRVAHWPVERYSRALEGAGLRIDALREPQPPADLVAAGVDTAKLRRVPNFLHLRATKA